MEVKVSKDRDKYFNASPQDLKLFKIFRAIPHHFLPWLLVQEESEMKSITVPVLASMPGIIQYLYK